MSSALAVNPDDFLHSLCVYLAAQTGLQYQGTPRQLWRTILLEQQAADSASVIVAYPGSPLLYTDRLPGLRLQVRTRGTDGNQSLRQSQAIFEAFTDVSGLPLRSLTLAAYAADAFTPESGNWLIVYANPLQRPGVIGIDDRGRQLFTFNVELGFKLN